VRRAANSDGRLTVRILAQPQGGLYVNTVSSTFEVTIAKDNGAAGDSLDSPIKLNWSWRSPTGNYNADSRTYSVVGKVDTIATSKSAPSGMYLDKKFWLDSRGPTWTASSLSRPTPPTAASTDTGRNISGGGLLRLPHSLACRLLPVTS